jgi:signal transduction histidine kinase
VLRLSLRAKLICSAVLVLTPVLGLLLFEFGASYDRRREIVLDSLEQTAEAVAALADGTFDEAIAVGRALASDPAIQSLDSTIVAQRLQWLATFYPEYDNLSVFDASGNLRGESVVTEPGPRRNIADRAFFQRAIESGRPTPIEVVLSRRTGRPATGVAIPFQNLDDEPTGVLVIAFAFDRLRERLESVGLRPDQTIGLIDPTGRLALLTERLDWTWEQRDLSRLPAVQAALAGQSVRTTEFRRSPDDEPRAAALAPSPKYGWIVSVGWPIARAFGPGEQARRQQLVAFVGIALLSLIGAAVLAGYVANPIRALARQALALGHGELDRRVKIRTGDELGQLGAAFNTMADQLQTTLTQLEALAVDNAQLYREAQGAIRVRDDFLASASHELRTPLAHIKGFASSLRQTDIEWDELTRTDFLAEIEREADRLARLIGDLLDLSGLESGGLGRAERAPARPADLVAGGLDRVRGLVPERRVELDLPADLPEVLVDASQIERVVANLLENAAKYATPGTAIRVGANLIQNGLELRVEDEGPGIPPEQSERVFEKFVRLETGRTAAAGTGLGLAICRRIVEDHGGKICAEQRSGGARIVMRLPLANGPGGSAR